MLLTIGMAVYKDLHRLKDTVQSLRMHQDLTDCEILVVDNFGCEDTSAFCRNWGCARYVRYSDVQGTAAPRERVFQEANGDYVLCIDSHVLLALNVIRDLKSYFRKYPDSRDMLQGPMLYDDLQTAAIAMDLVWRAEMFGTWSNAPVPEEPIEIPMHGLGLFAMRKAAWPGFNPGFRGFGGEEGYIHTKVRQAGGKVLCLPWLKWWHSFNDGGVPYRCCTEDKFRNYLIGCRELDIDPTEALVHFATPQLYTVGHNPDGSSITAMRPPLSRQAIEIILREIYP